MLRKCMALSAFLLIVLCCRTVKADEKNNVACWTFDRVVDNRIEDDAGNIHDQMHGKYTLVKGVEGKALRFDGFRTYIYRKVQDVPQLTGKFTIETWIALGAYPWFWAPVIEFRNAEFEGFMFGIDKNGHLGMRVPAADKWQSYLSEQQLPLRTWTHIAAVYDEKNQLSLYVNGKLTSSFKLKKKLSTPAGTPMHIGRNYTQEPWEDYQLTTTDFYSFFDGIIDELKIHHSVLSSRDIKKEYQDYHPKHKPDLPERVFPQVHRKSGAFGAYYTKLNYYDDWDALWRVSDLADVLVRFDNMTGKLIFWRGTSFVPCWVTENGIWFTNEWLETWGRDVCSCAEPIMDRDCRFSHVRIIENHDARTVVHWRYALVDAYYKFAAVSDDLRGEWCDEFYITYPDNSGIRKMILHYSKPIRPHDWAEQIVVLPPGTHPAEVISSPEITLVNMRGVKYSYAWDADLPVVLNKPEGANIQVINLKSKYRPFLILPPDSFETSEMKRGSPFFRTYSAEQGKGYRPDPVPSIYGWWNHWPIAQVPGDGRWVTSPDRASHFNLTTFLQWKDHELTGRTKTRIMIQGLTEKKPEDLVELAKSWLQAPKASILKGEFKNIGYDQAEKAYVIQKKNEGRPTGLQMKLNAGHETPLLNPALIIKKWGNISAQVYINDKPVPTEQFRIGHTSTLEGVNLVIWLKLKSTKPVQLSIKTND
ncbi:MAG TPA: LamG domain-containing protein [Planctomycetes bacterium]|nr:LamG domain-containing protein [Planctomycetota bacterium]